MPETCPLANPAKSGRFEKLICPYVPASDKIVVEKACPTSTSNSVGPTSLVGVGATIRSGTVVEAEAPLTPTLEAVRVKLMLFNPFSNGTASAAITRSVPLNVTPLVVGLTSPVRSVNPALLFKVTVLAVPAV